MEGGGAQVHLGFAWVTVRGSAFNFAEGSLQKNIASWVLSLWR